MTVVVIGPDSRQRLQDYFQRNRLSFVAIADPEGGLLEQWGQVVVWWRLGRMPSALGVDSGGRVVWMHQGRWMSDLPDWDEALQTLSKAAGRDSNT